MAKDLLSMNRQFTNGQTSQRQHHLARDFFGAHLVTPFGAYLVRLPCAPPSLGTLNPNHTIFLHLSNHHIASLGHGSSVL